MPTIAGTYYVTVSAMKKQGATTIDVYARVSRLGDDRQRSTEGQVEDCEAVVRGRGATVGEVHVDSGRSAWNPRVRRPGWARLMGRLETGLTGGVIIWDLARFSRRPIEGERLISAAESGLLVLDSEGEYDLTTPSGKKAFRDQLSGAAYESDRLSTRVKRGKRVKAMRGEPLVTRPSFGFEFGGVTINETEAAVIRELAGRLLAGAAVNELARDLDRRGIRTSYGKPFNDTAVRRLLLRESNAGLVIHNGAIVSRMPGEPILDEATYGQICAIFAARRRGRPISDTYLCSGIAVCALCLKPLYGRPVANMTPYPDGEIRRQYRCMRRAVNSGCGQVLIDQRGLDEHAAALAIAILSDPRHADAIEAAAQVVVDRRREIEKAIGEADELAGALADRLGRGELSLERYDRAITPLDKRLATLRADLAAVGAEPAQAHRKANAVASRATWRRRWNAATPAERRALLKLALGSVPLLVGPADPTNRLGIAGRITFGDAAS
jgi:site-specific DNA recombinase